MLLGSARGSGWTRKLAQALGSVAPASLALHSVRIDDLPLYHEDLEAEPPPAWSRFRDAIRSADALLFVSPEYNRSIPALLKNAIDIGSSPEDRSVWAKKPGGVVSFSPGSLGGFGANHHLRQCLVFLDVPVLQQPEMYLSRVDQLFDETGALSEDGGHALLSAFMTAFADWASRGLS